MEDRGHFDDEKERVERGGGEGEGKGGGGLCITGIEVQLSLGMTVI